VLEPRTPQSPRVAEVVDILNSLHGVYDPGEAVDELEHALQSAGRALDAGADDGLVVASLLHDIARSPLVELPAGVDLGHDEVARSWLTPRFGNRVGWLAGAHVAAKRYLAATDPSYLAILSPTSVASLAEQGGASADEAWTTHPWWPDALRLRRFDDAAKVPGAAKPSVAEVADVVRRLP
jgi:predicted HD phosphohydrolase